VDEEDEVHKVAEQVEAEDATNARCLQTTCAIKRRAEEDKADVAKMEVFQWHQEVQEH